MGSRLSNGPVGLGYAPAGPEMLSAVDSPSITVNPDYRQAGAVVSIQGTANLVLIAAPDPQRAGHFTARLAGGNRLLARSRAPFFDAARALIADGLDPATRLTMMHSGSATESLSATIGVAARYAVEERAHGPVLRRLQIARQSGVEALRMRHRDWVAASEAIRERD